MLTPLVSVVIPSYNYARFLPAAVESVRAQTAEDWELLIVDDGSTDDSVAVAEAFCRQDNRIRLFTQQNGGLSAARNTGLENAQGKYIQLLDTDDLIHLEKLAAQTAYLEAHPQADAVVGSWVFFPADPVVIHSMKSASLQGSRFLDALLQDNFMPVSAPLVRTSLMHKVGGFDPKLTSYEDWHYWIRCALAGARFDALLLPTPATSIRKGHLSMMQNRLKMLANGLKLRRYLHAHLSAKQRLYNRYRLLRLLTHQKMLQAGLLK